MRRTKKLQIGNMYRYDATATLAIGAPTAASGTAPAIDHGTSGASTTAVFSRSIANRLLSGFPYLQS